MAIMMVIFMVGSCVSRAEDGSGNWAPPGINVYEQQPDPDKDALLQRRAYRSVSSNKRSLSVDGYSRCRVLEFAKVQKTLVGHFAAFISAPATIAVCQLGWYCNLLL